MAQNKNLEDLIYKLVRTKMRQLRTAHGLTQAQIADKIGVTLQHYQQIESGRSPSNLRILSKLSEAFDIHISYFFRSDDVSIIGADGTVKADQLSSDHVVLLRKSADLSEEARASIGEFIRFKFFEQKTKQSNEKQER